MVLEILKAKYAHSHQLSSLFKSNVSTHENSDFIDYIFWVVKMN
jgi:hypothetical protein